MEIVSNCDSIYCFITYIMGAVFMLVINSIGAMSKVKEPRNKVHFYVTCELNHRGEIIRTLWLGKPCHAEDGHFKSNIWSSILGVNESFAAYNLNYSDFDDMKVGEIREVYLDLED